MRKLSLSFVAAISALIISTTAFSADDEIDHFYVKADLGSTTFSSFESPTVGVASESKVGDLIALSVGLEIGPILSFELGHNQFGKQEGQLSAGGSFENEVSSNSLSVVPTIPLGKKTKFFIELGEHVWESKAKAAGVSSKTDGSDFFYGFGFTYDVREPVRVGFEFSQYEMASEDFETTSVSLAYVF
jgi:hypothetical protein